MPQVYPSINLSAPPAIGSVYGYSNKQHIITLALPSFDSDISIIILNAGNAF